MLNMSFLAAECMSAQQCLYLGEEISQMKRLHKIAAHLMTVCRRATVWACREGLGENSKASRCLVSGVSSGFNRYDIMSSRFELLHISGFTVMRFVNWHFVLDILIRGRSSNHLINCPNKKATRLFEVASQILFEDHARRDSNSRPTGSKPAALSN